MTNLNAAQNSLATTRTKQATGVRSWFGWFLRVWQQLCRILLVQPSLTSFLEPLIRLWQPAYRAGWYRVQWLSCQRHGQFLLLRLKPCRHWTGFLPGQHLTLMVEINGRAVSRTFSISSALQQFQQDGSITLCLQIQPGGQLTSFLAAAMSKQPQCYISAATGDFVLQQQQQPLLMLAAGSGITPLFAMLSSISRLTQPLTLIYSSRDADPVLAAECSRLQEKFPLLQFIKLNSTTAGRLKPEMLLAWVPDLAKRRCYLCGPTGFSQQWQQWLQQQGVPEQAILQESFGLQLTATGNAQSLEIKTPGGILQTQSQGNLLQSLEQAGLTPRYGCRRGICMQCLCQKQQGQVRHLFTGELSGKGAELIQLCLSEAVTALQLDLTSQG
jgi:ferredoxin-NADP reductase